jgi:hypothetical protein
MVLALFQHCVVLITSSLFGYLVRRTLFCLLWRYALSVYAETWLVLAEEDCKELAISCVDILSVSSVLPGLGMIWDICVSSTKINLRTLPTRAPELTSKRCEWQIWRCEMQPCLLPPRPLPLPNGVVPGSSVYCDSLKLVLAWIG